MNLNTRLSNRRYFRYFVDLRTLYKKKEIVVYTSLILSLFTITFFGLFALRPTLVTVAGLIKETQEKGAINKKLQSKIDNLTQAQQNYSKLGASVEILNQAFPKEPELSSLIYQIEILAQKTNIQLLSLNFTPVDLVAADSQEKKSKKTDSGFNEVNFDLTAKGDFASLKNFLLSLDTLRRIVLVDSFTINQSKMDDRQGMGLSINGKAFYLHEVTKQ
ncbi:MAG: type 4a pilus biogenesis protein PilO [bacterium]|nr:type 4a pilus biogenesis protein PilO [bacterium]